MLKGDLKPQFVEVIKSLFDSYGRRIPKDLASAVCDANRDFYLEQPTFNFEALAESYRRHFPRELVFPSASELEDKGLAVIEWIKKQEQLANLVKGPHFILGFPKMLVPDYGQVLEEIYLTAVESAYKTQFPDRQFVNRRKGTLKGQVGIVEASRNRLHLLLPEKSIVGIWFPTCLQGFSSIADREQMATLLQPEKIWLTGAFEASAGIVGYTKIIARDYHTPGLDMAANSWQSSQCSLLCGANDGGLVFGAADRRAYSVGSYSGGLFCLG